MNVRFLALPLLLASLASGCDKPNASILGTLVTLVTLSMSDDEVMMFFTENQIDRNPALYSCSKISYFGSKIGKPWQHKKTEVECLLDIEEDKWKVWWTSFTFELNVEFDRKMLKPKETTPQKKTRATNSRGTSCYRSIKASTRPDNSSGGFLFFKSKV